MIFHLALPLAGLLLISQSAEGGSATWSVNPTSGDWNIADNWTPATVPNGLADTAAFSNSNETSVYLSKNVTLEALVFDPGAASYTINLASYSLSFYSGAGIANNSGITQNIVVPTREIFIDSGTAGSQINFVVHGGVLGSAAISFGGGSAGSCNYLAKGPAARQTQGGIINFENTGSADHGNFTFEGSSVSGATGAFTVFRDLARAGSAIFHLGGASANGAIGSFCLFSDSSNAENATFVNNGGLVEGAGGATMLFQNRSLGGRARIELFGNSSLDISDHFAPGVTTGSIEGDGDVFLGGAGSAHGASNLTIGSNNLSTTFSGVLHDGGQGGGTGASFTKRGHGRLILSGPSCYTGGTTVTGGALFVTNTTGSATGSGSVQVSRGALGGTGIVAGPVMIASGSNAAFLAPGNGKEPGILTLLSALTFNPLAIYKVNLYSDMVRADQVIASGVTINSGAQIFLGDLASDFLAAGTIFTVISNTSGAPIAGTFSNLGNASTLTVGANTYWVSYEGGDGNDLTLTVL